MPIEWTRRAAMAAAATLPATRLFGATSSAFEVLERRHGGRLGVAALDTGTGKRLTHRADERFPMCSTFKLLLTAMVLARVDEHQERLDRRIAYRKADLLENAPVTRAHVGEGGMNVGALCAAIMAWSDNTATKVLMRPLGGPPAVTHFARTLGDSVTRVDRMEPLSNSAIPGDPRDTTSPSAMVANLDQLTLGRALSEESRSRLVTWLAACRTAEARIPAGIPAGWRSGNRTGTGDNGSTNDVAILWPPGRSPVLVAGYYTGSPGTRAAANAVLAEVGRIVAAWS